MQNKISIFEKYSKHLKFTSFFGIPFPSFESAFVLNVLNHFQQMLILYMNSILMLQSNEETEKTLSSNPLLSFFLFLSDEDFDNNPGNLAKLLISITGIFIMMGLLVSLLVKLSRGQRLQSIVKHIFHSYGYFYIFFLSSSIHNYFINLFFIYIIKGSENGAYYIAVAFILIGLISNVCGLFGYLISLIPIKSEDPFARLSNSYLTTNLAQKFGLVSIICALNSNQIWNKETKVLIIAILNFIFSLQSTWRYFKRCPFLHFKTIYQFAFLQSIVLAGSFANLISLIELKYYDFGFMTIFFQFMLLSLLFSKIAINLIHHKSRNNIFLSGQERDNTHFWENIMMITHIKKRQISLNKDRINVNIELEFERLMLTSSLDVKKFFEEKSKSSCPITKLSMSYLQLFEFQELYNCYLNSQALLQSSLTGLTTKMGALYLQNEIEILLNKDSEANKVIQQCFLFMRDNEYFEKNILNFLESYAEFFKLLKKNQTCLDELAKASERTQLDLATLKQSWNKIEDNYEKIPLPTSILYTLLLERTRIERIESFLVSKSISKSINSVKKSKSKDLIDFTSNENIVSAFISLEAELYGKVIDTNKTIGNMLGFSMPEIIGKNFNCLFPPFLFQVKKSLLKTIENSISSSDLSRLTKTFIIHKKGFIIPCQLRYNFFVNPNYGFGLGMVFEKTEKFKETVLSYIVFHKILRFKSFSSKCFNLIDENDLIVGATSKFYPIVEIGTKVKSKDLKIEEEIWLKKAEEIEKLQDDNPLFTGRNTKNSRLLKKKISIMGLELTAIQIADTEEFEMINLMGQLHSDASADIMDIAVEVDGSEVERHLIDQIPHKKIKISVSNASHHSVTSKNAGRGLKAASKIELIQDNIERQSTYTGKSERNPNTIHYTYDSMQKNLTFYKFGLANCLFIVFLIFLIFFAGTILTSYLNGIRSIDDVTIKIKLMVDYSNRHKQIFDALNNVFNHDVFRYLGLIYPPSVLPLAYGILQRRGLAITPNISRTNNLIKMNVSMLSDLELKSNLYYPNIKTFYGSMGGLLETDEYQIVDNFKASDEIVSKMNIYFKKIKSPHDSYMTQLRSNIYADIFNDFQIQNENIQNYLEKSIKTVLSDINSITNVTYSITLAALIIYTASILYVIGKYYKNALDVLKMFANHPNDDIAIRIIQIEDLKKTIERGINEESVEFVKFGKENSAMSKFNREDYSSKKLFINIFVKKIIFLTLLLIPVIILLLYVYNFTFQNYSTVMASVDNILKIGDIAYQSMFIYYVSSLTQPLNDLNSIFFSFHCNLKKN